MRIFVCEDSAGYRLVIKSVLETEPGFEVVGEACDGQQCIDQVARADPDVVLLDINMPRMNGLEALPEVLHAVPDAKIVMLSTGSAEEYEQRSLAKGAHGYIEKPASAPDLLDALRVTLTDAA